MSALGLTTTIIATELLRAIRQDSMDFSRGEQFGRETEKVIITIAEIVDAANRAELANRLQSTFSAALTAKPGKGETK